MLLYRGIVAYWQSEGTCIHTVKKSLQSESICEVCRQYTQHKCIYGHVDMGTYMDVCS